MEGEARAHGDVRRANLALVLSRLLADGPQSRAALAASTGLMRSTVSSLVAELEGLGLVEHAGRSRGRVGRPGQLIAPRAQGAGSIGVELGVDRVRSCLVDLERRVRCRWEATFARGDGREALATLDASVATAREAAREVGVRVHGIGVAAPGLVDLDGAVLVRAPNLDLAGVDLAAALGDGAARGLPVAVDNEANLAALAEWGAGAAPGEAAMLYVSGGVGIGAGVIVHGRLLRGAHGFGGELGHVTVMPDGPLCGCGARGCLEALAGEATGATPQQRGRWLGIALASAVNLVDPAVVVLGGFLAEQADELVPQIEVELRARVLGQRHRPTRIVRGVLGREAAMRGAAELALAPLLADPGRVAA